MDSTLDDIVQEEQRTVRRGGRVGRGGPGRGASASSGRGAMSARSAIAAGKTLRPARMHTAGAVLRRNPPAEGSKTIKVAAASVPKTVAGSIAHSAREGEAPVVLCRGVDATNQTIKAIAIARSYLTSDGFDLRAQIEFQSRDSPEATITITRILRPAVETDSAEELNVKKESDPYKVAGALAGRVRDNKRVCVVGLGPDAVFRCVETVAIARRYLTDNSLDLTFAPEFFALRTSDGTELSALRFCVYSAQV